jgi:membrane-associated phospholipid phosphatase
MKKFLVIFILYSGTVSAEENFLRWKGKEHVAEILSDVTVYTGIGLDTWDSWKSGDRKRAYTCQGIRLGLSVGVNELTKRLVKRERPDGSDEKSFYSMHTSSSMVSSGWNFSIGIPISIGTGALRMGANRHFGTDILVGAGMGILLQKVCSKE